MMTNLRPFLLAASLLLLLASSGILAQDATEPPPDLPASIGDLEPIEIGDTVEGELTGNAPSALFVLTAQADDVIAMTMTSDDVDAYLQLGDTQGNPLLSDDDGADNLNARIGPVRMPASGAYILAANSFDYATSGGADGETGEFTLSVTSYEAEPLDYPGEVEATLSEDDALLLYSFEGQAGDVVLVSMDSEDFDTYLVLSQADNLTGAAIPDDDGGEGANALVGPYILPVSGEYFVTASSYAAGSEGDFTLAVRRIEPQPVEFDTPVDASLTEDDPALVYTFDASAGDVVNVVVEGAGELDTTLTVLGPDGEQVGYNDDANGRNPALAGLQLTSSGVHSIVVQPFVRGENGEFRLTLSQAGGS